MLKSNFGDVQAFHDRFGLDRDRPPHRPRLLPLDLLRFRLGFLLEEIGEFAAASGAPWFAQRLAELAVEARKIERVEAGDLVGAFDALLDLSVVTLGTADFLGVPWEAGWDAVMAANLRKRRAAPDGSDSKRGSPFDVVKPEGWVGPEAELERLLAPPLPFGA